jgi:aminoglycoside phosphotransferase (APT) family kinase protein
MLHGDLVEANVVWGPGGPALVDWEFWRLGDPAEDLAYACELNRLPPAACRALLAGYGAPGMEERIDAWRTIVALDAAAWYLREGMPAQAAPLLTRGRRLPRGRGR